MVITFGTKQGVFAKTFEETLSIRFCRQHCVALGIIGYIGRYNICKLFSDFFVTYVSVKTIISNSLKTLPTAAAAFAATSWQDVL